MDHRIRPATPADGPGLAAIYGPIVARTAISFEEIAPDADEMGRRVAATAATHPWLVAERDGAIDGYAYATVHRARAAYRWSVETSAYVAERARGRGIARALYLALVRILAAQGFRTAFAGIVLPNEASLRLHRGLGFADVGTFPRIGYKGGAWHDVYWLALALGSYGAPPNEPRPLATFGEGDLAALIAGS